MKSLSSAARGLLAVLILVIAPQLSAQSDGRRVLFETGFEAFEGYDHRFDLVDDTGRGQNGWASVGYAGNGILTNHFDGQSGNWAYVGFWAPTNQLEAYNLFRPVRFTPTGVDQPVVRFTVNMVLSDSTTNRPFFDDFRWSVYTPDDQRLFTFDFAGTEQVIDFALNDDVGFRPSGFSFDYQEFYALEITMSFPRNRWSASINGTPIIVDQPITVRNLQLALGSIDAVWAMRTPGQPGDNFMAFDDYRIEALPARLAPFTVEASRDNLFTVLVRGEPGVTYLVEGSNDFRTWETVGQVVARAGDGLGEIADPGAARSPARFYRAQSVGP
jgi:hypothetical protein